MAAHFGPSEGVILGVAVELRKGPGGVLTLKWKG